MREHLLPGEVEAMLKAAKVVGRYGHRDQTLILLAYRHGLRISELVALRWEQVDFSGTQADFAPFFFSSQLLRPKTKSPTGRSDSGVDTCCGLVMIMASPIGRSPLRSDGRLTS